MDGGDDGLPLVALVLVTFLDRFGFPVGPVDRILKDSQSENVVESGVGVVSATEDDARIAAFQIGHSDIVFTSVSPKDFIGFVGNGKGVGPAWMSTSNKGHEPKTGIE